GLERREHRRPGLLAPQAVPIDVQTEAIAIPRAQGRRVGGPHEVPTDSKHTFHAASLSRVASDPISERDAVDAALELAAAQARRYLDGIDQAPVFPADAEQGISGWNDPMPETGDGALVTLTELAARAEAGATRSSGPRFFHFVMGGGTPAALGADWLTSAYDQVAYGWASSPFAARLEQVAVDWLRQLVELPPGLRGGLASRAPMGHLLAPPAAPHRR